MVEIESCSGDQTNEEGPSGPLRPMGQACLWIVQYGPDFRGDGGISHSSRDNRHYTSISPVTQYRERRVPEEMVDG